ncbi:MAG TPA: hypothetical protein VGQ72_08070 [Pyrinomonadaceae bacterium]|nr:hypothetical protein [Pyrinomonadaceae bacterium]
MNKKKVFLSLSMAAIMITLPLSFVSVGAQATQNQASALMRGYRAGYSDGYPAGAQDSAKQADRDFRAKAAYQQADRAYSPSFGSLDEYRNGYQQGFEVGYNDGYDRKNFDSTIPDDLKVREQNEDSQAPTLTNANRPDDRTTNTANLFVIPPDTVMRVELGSNLSTDASQNGDQFQAKVLEPKEYEGAMIEGRVTRVKRPGKVKGTAELQLSFDEIRLVDGRSAKMSAQVIEVLQTGTSQGVGKVDPEGGVQGKDSTKGDVAKVGAATGVGAIIGAIFGGGTGAAVGATIGAGVGTAGVLRERGKDIYLYQGQQLRIRTAGNAEIQ